MKQSFIHHKILERLYKHSITNAQLMLKYNYTYSHAV